MKSFNVDTKVDEEVGRTCGDCGSFKSGYCPDKGIGMDPNYHCNKTR